MTTKEARHPAQTQARSEGVESVDGDGRLPPALEKLLQELERDKIDRNPDLSEPEYGDFFSNQRHPSSNSPWQNKVRLRVIQALGSCKSLKSLGYAYGQKLPQFTSFELNALLQPLSTSPVLQSLGVDFEGLDVESAEFQSACSHLQNLLQNSDTLKRFKLRLGNPRTWPEERVRHSSFVAAGVSKLALGLQANYNSSLNFLTLQGWVEATVGVHIANMIRWARNLLDLSLVDVSISDDADVLALSEGLRHRPSLFTGISVRTESGEVEGKGVADLLLRAFAGEMQTKSTCELYVCSIVEGLGRALPTILSSSRSLTSVILWDDDMAFSPEEWRQIGKSLLPGRRSSTLQTLSIRVKDRWGDEDWFDGLGTLLQCASSSSSSPSPVIDIGLWLIEQFVDYEPGLVRLGNVVRQCTSVRQISISCGTVSKIRPFVEALENNCSLPHLHLYEIEAHVENEWCNLFRCLRSNTHIERLTFERIAGLDDDAFKEFMEVLKTNFSLKEIDFKYTPWNEDGKAAWVKDALERYSKQEKYFGVVREANLKFEKAKAGRLFLCGSPFAGKTQLRRTLLRSVDKRSWWEDKVETVIRTQGIEVDMLRDDEHMQISIWDLAGQDIYRALQSIVFPRASEACVFVYLFNPLNDDPNKGSRASKTNVESSLHRELEDWLQFIASSSRVTGRKLPGVLVVLTHMDLMEHRNVQWAWDVVRQLKIKYQGILDICEGVDVQQIDARSKREVHSLKKKIFSLFQDRLHQESHDVPRVCSEIVSKLAKRTSDVKSNPIWDCDRFYKWCTTEIKELKKFDPRSEDGTKLLGAIATYLHDVGTILLIPDSKKIIVDAQWLTHTFLGELVTVGHNFQRKTGQFSQGDHSSPATYFYSEDGFVGKSTLQDMLSRFSKKHLKSKHVHVTEETLLLLLVKLNLCFQTRSEKGHPLFFIPTIIARGEKGENSERQLPPWMLRNLNFIGFRIQCQDRTRTSLTSAFFPRLQIHLREVLMSTEQVLEENITCSRYYIRIIMDGHEIFLEQGEGAGNHVDVLVGYPSGNQREKTSAFIMTKFVDEVRTFSASSTGCPGVALVVAILRTECVTRRTPFEYRVDSQAVLIQKLKMKVKTRIQDIQDEITLGAQPGQVLDDMFYDWPAVHDLPARPELVEELLSSRDIEDVIQEVRKSQVHQRNNLVEVSEELGQSIASDNSEPSSSTQATEHKETVYGTAKEFRRSATSIRRRLPPDDDRFSRLEARVDNWGSRLESRVADGMQGIQKELRAGFQGVQTELKEIKVGQNEIRLLMGTFLSRLDQLIGFSESLARARTPKRPFFSSNDASFFKRMVQKVNAAIHVGVPVTLHLMCESKVRPHPIEGQEGLPLILEKENMEWVRCISLTSVRMMWYLLKAGVHITTALGQIVPDLPHNGTVTSVSVANALILATDTSSLGELQTCVRGEYAQKEALEEAWCSLRDYLAPKLDNNFTTLFCLHRVRYSNLEDGGYAWLCRACMLAGKKIGTLEPM